MPVRIAAAACAGFFLALSFPRPGFALLSWVSVAPLLIIAARSRPLHALFYGLVFGEAFFVCLIYWIFHVLRNNTSMGSIMSICVLLCLSSYLSLFPSFFSFAVSQSIVKYGRHALFFSPVIWVALEFIRNYALSGFPWGSVGYSQASVISLIQIASVSGVYGISFVIILVNASFAFCIIGSRKLWRFLPLAMSVVLVAVLILWGYARIESASDEGETLNVACIQGNYGGTFNEVSDDTDILAEYIAMTHEAVEQGAALIVWPETTSSFEICCTSGYEELLKEMCRNWDIDLVLGSIHQEMKTKDEIYYNSAFHMRADGTMGERYDKMHLVPYGEYVPMPRLLFFVRKFVEMAGDFSKGKDYTIMTYKEHPFAVLICYEVIFPEAMKRFAHRGATFFVNITNDAWFGDSSAPYQHFDFLKIRSVETGRFFVRCAATGISGIVSPYGKVLQETKPFSREIIVGPIKTMHSMTVYMRYGDVLAIACVIMSFILIASSFTKRRRRSTIEEIEEKSEI